MHKFRKKPVVIDAYQLPLAGQPVPESFDDWCIDVGFGWDKFESDRDDGMIIYTPEGDVRADPGDWIIKGVAGEFYPCKPDIFAATYEAVGGDTAGADFSSALIWLKEGKAVCRRGWNGRGQFVIAAGGYVVDEARPGSDYDRAGIKGQFKINSHLDLRNAQGEMQPGWVPSQGDLFASDWMIYDPAA